MLRIENLIYMRTKSKAPLWGWGLVGSWQFVTLEIIASGGNFN